MVMKDKVEKLHRKGYYFKAKKIGIGLSIFSIAAAFIFIPTYISFKLQPSETTSKADNETEESAVNEEEITQLLNY